MPDETNNCSFSIIIPVLNEQTQINSVLTHLRKINSRNLAEIIVVDGDSDGQTINAINDDSIIKLISKKGRAVQMNAGAEIARGQIIIFLHADTRLPESALEKIDDCLQNQKYVGGAFSLHIDSDSPWLKYISASTSNRSQKSRIPYGDQAIFIRKSCFGRYRPLVNTFVVWIVFYVITFQQCFIANICLGEARIEPIHCDVDQHNRIMDFL